MHIHRIVLGLLVLFIVQSCSTTSLVEEGETAFKEGNYKTALTKWEQIIKEIEQQGKKVDSSLYYKTGKAALKLEQKGKARQYYEWADDGGYSSPDMYLWLSKKYNEIDNLTLEIEALENYHKDYPDGEKIDSINVRLFETYVESKQWNKAENLWPDLEEEVKSKLDMQKAWFKVNKELENDEKCDKLADQILEKDPDNLSALEWNALKYFWKADDLYVKVMKAYQNNRTTKQYKKLLKAWDKIWPDFRKSRDYFKKLYQLDPKARYAEYLGHIYKRMDKDQKAEYWNKKAEKED
ncbi:MAG: hypothetical protein K9J27_06765 [Bacteroidales bacterium]|nr:hypothetical protein [Bacteroidales bacterium]MCF8333466.1 hypothetical protein [Bacteroidales bacterium]